MEGEAEAKKIKFISIDPGWKNMGVVYGTGVIDRDKKTIEMTIDKKHVFTDALLQDSIQNYRDEDILKLIKSWLYGTFGSSEFDGSLCVIEEQFFKIFFGNPGKTYVSHRLSKFEAMLFATMTNLFPGFVVCKVKSDVVKNRMLGKLKPGEAKYDHAKTRVVGYCTNEGFWSSDEKPKAITPHEADCLLNLKWKLERDLFDDFKIKWNWVESYRDVLPASSVATNEKVQELG